MTFQLTNTELDIAAKLLREGAVIAYATEAVFALGCDPLNRDAVYSVYDLKQRNRDQGFLLIGADLAQLAPFVDWRKVPAQTRREIEDGWPGPVTWVVPRTPATPEWLVGYHDGVAVRVTAHEPAVAMCRAYGGVLVSTSANPHGSPPARTAEQVTHYFGTRLGAVVDAPLGRLERPTPVRHALTGAVLRA